MRQERDMTRLRQLVFTFLLAAPAVPAIAQDAPAPEMTDKQKASYSVGIQLGTMVAKTPELIDQDALVAGLRDAIDGKAPKLSDEEMARVVQDLQAKMQAATNERNAKMYADNKMAGELFLEQNAKAAGWKVTQSGLQYKVVTQGTGRTPTKADRVRAHYRGTFIDGKEFDSSYKRGEPTIFGLTQVIPGWTEALQLMKVGDKWEIVVPYQLAYGEAGRAGIPPFSVLRFEIELVEIVAQQPKAN
jgi:FKBP-type peptidyl-prolyl cis-trans isomerase